MIDDVYIAYDRLRESKIYTIEELAAYKRNNIDSFSSQLKHKKEELYQFCVSESIR